MSTSGAAFIPIPTPPTPSLSHDTAMTGKCRPAIEIVRLFSSEEWEIFIQEWTSSLKKQYSEVGRFGGSGDMGRDVCAYYGEALFDRPWDNFQCKHYDAPLTPSDVWVELGKLCYFTHIKAYSKPKNYYFVAPRGCGAKLSTLLQRPIKLRDELIAQWGKACESNIRTEKTPLDASLLQHIQTFDFSIVKPLSILRVIEDHKKTCWHVARFGGGLPERPDPPSPPDSIDSQKEARYVEQLLSAYGDHLKISLARHDDLVPYEALRQHFQRSREQFYYAESLRAFSRDTLPPGQFERLQREFLDGVIDVVTGDHKDGFTRVQATVNHARLLQITSHPLASRIFVNDRCGICHQLANEDKIKWVQ